MIRYGSLSHGVLASSNISRYKVIFSKTLLCKIYSLLHIPTIGFFHFGPQFAKKLSMDSSGIPIDKILGTSIKAANHAGKMVRDIMKRGDLGIIEKTGANDLQTAADRAANDIILGSFKKAIPELTVIGEEGVASANIDPTWLVEGCAEHELKNALPEELKMAKLDQFTVWVDPLDATKEYADGFLDHVTVLIGIALGKKSGCRSYPSTILWV